MLQGELKMYSQILNHHKYFNAIAITMLTLFILISVETSISTVTAISSTPRRPYKNTQYALNWAGYVVASDFNNPQPIVTMANGSWIVQTVSTSKKPAYSSQWVGIGGYFESTLIQTGTESDSGQGTTNYYAWYELLPAAETPLPTGYPVNPGDRMNALIFLVSTNSWNITLNDLTKPWHYSIIVSYTSSQQSAEWIEERPSIAGSITTLANFGTASFGYDYTTISNTNYATINSVTAPIGSLTYQSIIMVNNNGRNLAVPSALTSDGTSFTVSYAGR